MSCIEVWRVVVLGVGKETGEGFYEFLCGERGEILGHLFRTCQGWLDLREAIYLIAALTFDSASNTDRPALPSSVPRQVPDRYWKTPLAELLLFLLCWL